MKTKFKVPAGKWTPDGLFKISFKDDGKEYEANLNTGWSGGSKYYEPYWSLESREKYVSKGDVRVIEGKKWMAWIVTERGPFQKKEVVWKET